MTGRKTYDQKYDGEEYYWGKEPSALCSKVTEIIRPGVKIPKLIDLGSGEGRDVVYFAGEGFDVTGVDLSTQGLEKTKKLAEEMGVQVKTIEADITNFELKDKYDVIFSTGTLHFLTPEIRERCFQNYKKGWYHRPPYRYVSACELINNF